MSDICLPIPEIKGGTKADIIVRLPEGKGEIKYRLEAFNCGTVKNVGKNKNDEVFSVLKKFVDNYDDSWELIQAFAPIGEEKKVKVLYKLR